jgi:superfamily I DNA and/or RNA helicase
MMITTLGQQTIFAGDPNQLSPIARTENKSIRGQLTRTAFDTFSHVKTTRLNEQSRMTQAICTAIGTTFYDGDLRVCRKAARDAEWKRERSAFYVDGREVPRICFDEVGEPATYSPKYGGFIRYDSAQLVLNACDKLAGSYVDPSDIVVLTPFRAQVALIRQFLRRNHPQISVSTIHRAQGSEKTLVIVDPVDASSPFFSGAEGRRLINVAISRAKAHVVIPIHGGDLANPSLKKIHTQSTKFWNRAGNFAQPFTFR